MSNFKIVLTVSASNQSLNSIGRPMSAPGSSNTSVMTTSSDNSTTDRIGDSSSNSGNSSATVTTNSSNSSMGSFNVGRRLIAGATMGSTTTTTSTATVDNASNEDKGKQTTFSHQTSCI